MKLKRITANKNGYLTNACWNNCQTDGVPHVGSKYCKKMCPHYKGEIKILCWNFVKCNNWK